MNIRILYSALIILTLSACGSGGGSSTSSEQMPGIPDAALSRYQFSSETGHQSYEVSTLHAPGRDMMGVALNDSGVIAGNHLDGPGHSQGFIWDGNLVEVVIRDGQVSKINENNVVTGWEEVAGRSFACLYDDALVSLQEGKAYAINDNGVVAGLWQQAAETKPFIDNGRSSSVPISEFNGYGVLINNSDDLVLHELLEDSVVPHLLKNGRLTPLPTLGGDYTYARDMNSSGEVVGWSENQASEYRSILWKNGLLYDITPPNENHCAAVGINDLEEIAIKCTGMQGNTNYIYHDGDLTELGNLGAKSATVNDINNNGQITGWLYMEETGHTRRAFLATPW